MSIIILAQHFIVVFILFDKYIAMKHITMENKEHFVCTVYLNSENV